MRKTLIIPFFHIALLLSVLLFAVFGEAAESVVEGAPDRPAGDLWYVDIVCTADTDNSFDTLVTTGNYCGYFYAFSVIPGSTGPTDNSDLDIYHTVAGAASSSEMLGAQGDNVIDNATDNFVTLTSEVAVCGPLGIDMENNAVNSASFTLRLYFRIPGTE